MDVHPAALAIPEMTHDDFVALRDDIEKHGLLTPIETLSGRIIDGRHRYRACCDLGIPADSIEVDLDGMTPAEYVWSLNGARRHLTPSQKAAVALDLLPELEKEAKRRQGSREDIVEKIPQSEKARSRDKAAALIGVNAHYITDAKSIKDKSPATFAKVKSGELNLSQAKRDLKREDAINHLRATEQQHVDPLLGKFDVIVIDPPWPMVKIERDVRPNQVAFDYPTMTEDELAKLVLPVADNCHVWLWTTHRFLPMAFRLLDVWGLSYVCTFVWHKPGGFQPVGLPQYNCEFALYARHGSPIFVETKELPVCFNAERGKHSEKPEDFYGMLRRVTAGRRADMFNRRKIEGFVPWGQEAAT